MVLCRERTSSRRSSTESVSARSAASSNIAAAAGSVIAKKPEAYADSSAMWVSWDAVMGVTPMCEGFCLCDWSEATFGPRRTHGPNVIAIVGRAEGRTVAPERPDTMGTLTMEQYRDRAADKVAAGQEVLAAHAASS